MMRRMTVFVSFEHGVVPNAIKAGLLDVRGSNKIQRMLSRSQLKAVTSAITADTLHLFEEDTQVGVEAVMDAGWPMLLQKLRTVPVEQHTRGGLDWWVAMSKADAHSGHLHANHILAARLFLAMPAGSAPSEATFSSTGEAVTKKRNQLSDATLEMITVIRHYLRSDDFNLDQLIASIGADAEAAVAVAQKVEEAQN